MADGEQVQPQAPPQEQPERPRYRGEAGADKVRRYPCKQCGADIEFSPGSASLKCPYCNHEEKIPQSKEEIKEYSFSDFLAKPRKRGLDQPQAREVKCKSCGGAAILSPDVTASSCPYCGLPMVIEEAVGGGASDIIAPEAVVPFAINKPQALDKFRQWVASLWFAPGALKHDAQTAKICGFYRPYWTFDAHTVSYWEGERGDYYYVTETYTDRDAQGRTVTKTRQVRKIRWSWRSGTVREFFDDVLIDAGKDACWPTRYNLSGLKPYTPDFLSGWQAERYSFGADVGWPKAKGIIDDEIGEICRHELGGDQQRNLSIDTAYSGITYKHILLPLYLSSYHYGQKIFRFQVNGQTGEVRGERPYSWGKIILTILGVAAAVTAVVILIQHVS